MGSEGYTKIVEALAPITFESEKSRQDALLKAAERGNLELVEALIKSGTEIECVDYRGRTPLSLAVWQGHYTT
jgi:ankyrin repeat protein